jgi:SagB-type dehydrogenase family enzyme
MKKIKMLFAGMIAAYVVLFAIAGFAAELKPIKLLPPDMSGGKPLMQALKERRTLREFSPSVLPPQVLSDLLWAASGVNRPDSGKMTAPTAMDLREIDIYVAMADGLYRYDANANMLDPVLAEDLRSVTGEQEFVKDAPVNLIFVADLAKMSRMSNEDARFYAATDTGYISQNVYLYCASEGLATVARGWVNKPALAKAMKLRPDQMIILAQTVGYQK